MLLKNGYTTFNPNTAPLLIHSWIVFSGKITFYTKHFEKTLQVKNPCDMMAFTLSKHFLFSFHSMENNSTIVLTQYNGQHMGWKTKVSGFNS
jgi:hypothetical protein